jgi:hypothetical protein
MNKCFRYFFLTTLCIAFFVGCRAQDMEDSLREVIVQDTIYQNNTATSNENYQFKEPTQATRVEHRSVSGTELRKLKSDEDYWYINQKPPRGDRETATPDVNEKGKKEEKKSGGIFVARWLNILLWVVLIGGFTALLIWFLSTSNIRLFRKKPSAVDEVTEDQQTEDIFELNFEKEIQKAVDAKNYRTAVRLLYLRTLRDLSNRNLISYTHEKTNSDYLFQLAGTSYYKNFFRLTRNFDYTWYGQFELSQDSFGMIQNEFSFFKQQLS